MKKPVIKIIKRDAGIQEKQVTTIPVVDEDKAQRIHERRLRDAVTLWVNERYENRKAETVLALTGLRRLTQ
jgi:hypothetical protein